MLDRGKHIDSIVENLNALRQEISSKSSMGLTDLNTHCEVFMMNVLNIVYDLSLEDLNEKSPNFPGLDLGDSSGNGVAYQISAKKKGEKVNDTLKTCIEKKHYEKYKAIYVFILTSKQTSYTLISTSPHFEFDSATNILDFDDLFKKLKSLKLEHLKELDEYVKSELPYYRDRINGVEKAETPTTGQELVQSSFEPLLDPPMTMAQLNVSNHVLWSFHVEVNSLSRLTTYKFFDLLEKNGLHKALPLYSPQLRIEFNTNRIVFKRPIETTSAINRWDEEQSAIKKNCITYEFAEYNNDTRTLVNITHPLLSFIYILLQIEKVHQISSTNLPDLNVSVTIESQEQALFYPDYTPFVKGVFMRTYELGGNKFEHTEQLSGFDNETILNLVQDIYHAFICKSPNLSSPFISVDLETFETGMKRLRAEYG